MVRRDARWVLLSPVSVAVLLIAGCGPPTQLAQKPDASDRANQPQPAAPATDTTAGAENPQDAVEPQATSKPEAAPKTADAAPPANATPAPQGDADSEPQPAANPATLPADPNSNPATPPDDAAANPATPPADPAAPPADPAAKSGAAPADADDAADDGADDAVEAALPVRPPTNPFAPHPKLSDEELVALAIDMLNRSESVRRQPGFTEALVMACDRLIDKAEKPQHQTFGLLAKFKALHQASIGGDLTVEEALAGLADQYRDDARDKVAAYARLIHMERRVMAAREAPVADLRVLLAELKGFLGNERLTNNYLRLAALTVELVNRLDESERDAMFKELGDQYARSIDLDLANYGKRLGRDPSEGEMVDLIGQPMALAGTTATGELLEWDTYRGKVVVVDFWATWCGPCVREIPNVRAIFERHRRKGLAVVGVNLDTDNAVLRRFLVENAIPWPNLAGAEAQEAALRYRVRGIPTMLLIDREGKIVARSHRVEELQPKIEELLSRAPADE